jgi:hypothetical protein
MLFGRALGRTLTLTIHPHPQLTLQQESTHLRLPILHSCDATALDVYATTHVSTTTIICPYVFPATHVPATTNAISGISVPTRVHATTLPVLPIPALLAVLRIEATFVRCRTLWTVTSWRTSKTLRVEVQVWRRGQLETQEG